MSIIILAMQDPSGNIGLILKGIHGILGKFFGTVYILIIGNMVTYKCLHHYFINKTYNHPLVTVS